MPREGSEALRSRGSPARPAPASAAAAASGQRTCPGGWMPGVGHCGHQQTIQTLPLSTMFPVEVRIHLESSKASFEMVDAS
eukprot:scaffold127393_cov25-Prasinocladus_malaysianus.AAC.1